jgi:hypothetical protein
MLSWYWCLAHIKSIIVAPKPIEQEMSIHLCFPVSVYLRYLCSCSFYLRLYEHEVDKDYDKVVLDIFVGESLAARTLRQPDAFALGAVIGTTVGAVQVRDRV